MTSEESWSNVTKVLKDTFKLDDARIVWVEEVRNELRELAAAGISTAPDFTLHNETHSDNVVLLLGDLAQLIEEELSEYEARLLVAAAYLHDVGMFFSATRFRDDILPDLAESLRCCEDDFCDSGARYQDALDGKPVDFQIRAVHHLLSAYLIEEEGDRAFGLRARDKPHVIAICRGHRKANLHDQQCECYKNKPTQHGLVRRDLLAALLRLADALDFYPQRAPEGVFRTRAPDFLEDPVALKHWLKHYFATSPRVTINDQDGNRYLDCKLYYTVPTKKRLNRRSYKTFFTPLFNEFLEEAQSTDFDAKQYPVSLLKLLDIEEDIRVDLKVSAEPGAIKLPDKVVEEIKRSRCKDILEFLSYLESRKAERPKETKPQPVMDRRPEVQIFQILLDGDDPQHRLMLMVGDHGQGKTWLMGTFERMAAEKEISCLKVDLSDTIEFDDILDRIWRRLGPHHFPSYSANREKAGPLERWTLEERQRELTECFFADWLANSETPRLMLLLDTYERAAPMLQGWIEKSFLEKLKYIEQVIVVIGGRKWPEINGYWRKHGYAFPLEGVQVRDYKEYAEQRGVPIAEEDLVQLHRKMDGLPKLFVDYLDGLP